MSTSFSFLGHLKRPKFTYGNRPTRRLDHTGSDDLNDSSSDEDMGSKTQSAYANHLSKLNNNPLRSECHNPNHSSSNNNLFTTSSTKSTHKINQPPHETKSLKHFRKPKSLIVQNSPSVNHLSKSPSHLNSKILPKNKQTHVTCIAKQASPKTKPNRKTSLNLRNSLENSKSIPSTSLATKETKTSTTQHAVQPMTRSQIICIKASNSSCTTSAVIDSHNECSFTQPMGLQRKLTRSQSGALKNQQALTSPHTQSKITRTSLKRTRSLNATAQGSTNPIASLQQLQSDNLARLETTSSSRQSKNICSINSRNPTQEKNNLKLKHLQPLSHDLISVTQPPQRPAHDLSDIFDILDCQTVPFNMEKVDLAPVPKKPRVALMGGRSHYNTGTLSPTPSPSRAAAVGHALINAQSALSWQAGQPPGSPNRRSNVIGLQSANDLLIELASGQLVHETINSANLANLLGGGHTAKKTYGGEHTFKTDDNEMKLLLPTSSRVTKMTTPVKRSTSRAGSLRMLSSSKKFEARETYNELRKKWGVDEDDELSLYPSDLQTISHQRAIGSSKRFVDELSYLFEGLSSNSDQPEDWSLKQTSAVELVRKFRDQSFIDELKSNGLIERFYQAFRTAGAGDGDPVLDLALVVFISVMCCTSQRVIEPVLRITPKGSINLLSTQSDCLQILGNIVRQSETFAAKHLKRNAKKQFQLVSQIDEVVQKSVLNEHTPGPCSSQLLALFSLARIAMFSPRPGLLPQRSLVQSPAFVSVITCLLLDSKKLKNCLNEFSKGLDLLPEDGRRILQKISFCMDVLETCTLCEEEALNSLELFRESLSDIFPSLISLCYIVACLKEPATASTGLDILIGCLRTMVNVTNYNAVWAEKLATPILLQSLIGILNLCREEYDSVRVQLVKVASNANSSMLKERISKNAVEGASGRAEDVVFDLLCVTLGLLANLVEQSPKAQSMLKDIYVHGTSLPLSPECCQKCVCSKQIPAFEEIIQMYIQPPCSKADEREFIRGSISILVNLCLREIEQVSSHQDAKEEIEIKDNEFVIMKIWQSHLNFDENEDDGRESLKEFLKDLRIWQCGDGNLTIQDNARMGNQGFYYGGLEDCWKRLEVHLL
ncbi:hypothetical protein O181_074557 [Austropuccinia psidii MF-1]|uniref:Wings apart-like protein C-terminal domain-containing protein n=1 Tax=Austropuccinia psidii MF-1 TaxID=1389203 RepID=A0A9Q3FD96_9BASI|nr:hypothetical protein [Austropuccinia psidii MF-1]